MREAISVYIDHETVRELDDIRGQVPRSRVVQALMNRGLVEIRRNQRGEPYFHVNKSLGGADPVKSH